MQRMLCYSAAATAVLGLIDQANAQVCYQNNHQCFTFAPPPQDAGKVDTGLDLQSQKLRISGDLRLRIRVAETDATHPYPAADQYATRARARLEYQATEKAMALVEFNFAETWAGSASYSDALVGNNSNGISQAYLQVDDLLGFGDKWRVGRSEYILGNGLILGACDYLQVPANFTGAWVSKNIEGHDLELFLLDDYGPGQFQAANPGAGGVRYFGGTASINLTEDGIVKAVKPFALFGSRDGDRPSKDTWYGVGIEGTAPATIHWNAEVARREVDMGKDLLAWRIHAHKDLELFDGVVNGVSLEHTDSEGALHINPADFNSAGLLHQYGGAWRSDLQTTQLAVNLEPCCEIDVNLKVLSLNRRGTATQQGEFEFNLLVGKMMQSGVHLGAGYGVDDEQRQVGFFQMSLFF